ncbi:hypothetical protein DSL72_000051 [Monilinia vaccinii-corymbosi]|uniref:Glucose receptor Git3 N-terminal domain-containing protein n=1 Tax=Monilinia vaccinii-corymbosi TaxID=61207 RepID=A0A8A3PA53_9HELO|nr:hypothetical protein DSL72_000051 [Monilinia vaccinii-corymbosi]
MKQTLDGSSSSLTPLPESLSHGLVAVATFGLLSFFCSTSLFFYLTYKILSWRRQTPIGQGQKSRPVNQFLFLIYNLLFADIQQALAFLLNISSLKDNGIIVGTSTCWAQGWFVSTGDLASSVFISAIACHTFLSVVKQYNLPQWIFYTIVAGCWVFIYGLAVIGVVMHPKDLYVRASAWCWIGDKYENERLWLHYFWIFVAMFGTILIYACIFLYLHQSRSSSSGQKADYLHGAQPLMILYPLIYTICTIPLAAGRIAALAGTEVSLGYFSVAGSMIACNGWLDVLLYASTRADIVFSGYPPGEETGLETFAFMGRGHSLGTTTIIEAGALKSQGLKGNRCSANVGRRGGHAPSDSTDNLYRMGDISVAKNVSVRVSIASERELGPGGYPRGVGGYPRGVAESKDDGEDQGSDSGWDNSKGRGSESGKSGFSDTA